MHFNTHSGLAGLHAFLSASKHSWINYDEDKLDRVYLTALAAKRGTELHALAAEMIRLGIKAQGRNTFAMYVNDSIGWRMTPEQVLYYSPHAFGTADAIGFRQNKLRVSDLKTGVTPASFQQLIVYDAFFCLEYVVKPWEIEIENRIYQNDEVELLVPDPDEVMHVMDKIKLFSKRIEQIEKEAAL